MIMKELACLYIVNDDDIADDDYSVKSVIKMKFVLKQFLNNAVFHTFL